jgi:hypothetical protein
LVVVSVCESGQTPIYPLTWRRRTDNDTVWCECNRTPASLVFVLVWFGVSFFVWRRSPQDFKEREQVEEKKHMEEFGERANHKQNGLFNGYGWFAGGGGASASQETQPQQAAAGGGASAFIANMFGRSDPNGPPKFEGYG